MKRILFIIAVLFATSSFAIESNGKELLNSKLGGGGSFVLTNSAVTATVTHSNIPAIQVKWNNFYILTAALPHIILFKQYLLRSNSNNSYDTLVVSVNIVDTTFLDTSALLGVSYHYRLDRYERVTNDNYSNLSDTVVIQSVGLNDFGQINNAVDGAQVKIYPNPSKGVFTVESEIGIESVEVYDIFGAVVQLKRSSSLFSGTSVHPKRSSSLTLNNDKYRDALFEHSVTENKYQNERSSSSTTQGGDYRDAFLFNLTNHANGIYFLKIELENGEVVTKKVVKE